MAKRRNNAMLGATIVMGIIAVVLTVMAYKKGDGVHVEGIKLAALTTLEILPLILFAFVVAGMVQVLIPQETVSHWVGAESGMKGIIIGSVAGLLTPGGPYVSLPLAAGFIRTGAGLGTMVAFVTGWAVLGVGKIPMEVGIMGWKFTAIRLVTSFFFPPVAGLLAQALFSGKV